MSDLYPYQVDGQEFLAERETALLADSMGLGKSAQAIAAADRVGAKSILVICPASACINWQRELTRWLSEPKGVDTHVVSYDKARGSQRKALMAKEWDVLILDEAHFLKSWKAKRTRTVYGALCDGEGGLISRARYIWALSGTPAPNDVTELWPMMRALFPESLATEREVPMGLWDFRRRFTTGFETKYGYKVTGGRNLEELKERLAPHMLRRKTEEVLSDLPPIRYGEVVLTSEDLPAGLREAEAGFEGDVIREALAAGKLPGPSAAVATSTLRRLTGLAKVDPVIDLVTYELNEAEGKIVLFAHHREVINQLNWGLAEFEPCLLHGGLPEDQRQKAVDSFQKNPRARVFIGQLTAAGTAITLTAGASVLFVEYSWTPSDNQQAAKRCHRIGQTNSVLVRFVSLAGSLDEDIARVVRDKTETLSKVIS
ncbi:MAG: DEAD/DEAH box helicase [Leptospirillia bacterium]